MTDQNSAGGVRAILVADLYHFAQVALGRARIRTIQGLAHHVVLVRRIQCAEDA